MGRLAERLMEPTQCVEDFLDLAAQQSMPCESGPYEGQPNVGHALVSRRSVVRVPLRLERSIGRSAAERVGLEVDVLAVAKPYISRPGPALRAPGR